MFKRKTAQMIEGNEDNAGEGEQGESGNIPFDEQKGKKVKISPETRLKKMPSQGNPVLIAILVFFILQVSMSGYMVYTDIVRSQQEAVQRAALSASVAKYTASLDAVTTQMLQDYKKEVYNNQNVNTTSKQEVLGTEYNFMALMLVAKQNSRLMEILTQIK